MFIIYNTNVFSNGIYLFKINNGNIRTMCEISSKLTVKALESRQWRRCVVFIVNYEQISHILVVFSMLTLNKNAVWVPVPIKSVQSQQKKTRTKCITLINFIA